MNNLISFIIESAGGSITLPVNPENLNIARSGNNAFEEIVSLGEVAVLRTPKLATIEISSFFPFEKLPFATDSGNPRKYIDFIQKMWNGKKTGRLIVTSINENMEIAVNDFEYDRKAGEHEDVYYKLSLTEYRPYGAKALTLKEDGKTAEQAEPNRSKEDKPPTGDKYSVKPGDSLWKIAKQNAPKGASWQELYDLNEGIIGANPNLIKPGQELVFPEGWTK